MGRVEAEAVTLWESLGEILSLSWVRGSRVEGTMDLLVFDSHATSNRNRTLFLGIIVIDDGDVALLVLILNDTD